jgi:hypothetical protein
MHGLDDAFDSFMAATLDFPHDFTSDVDVPRYSSPLQQIRLGIKQGGYWLTSAALIVPAALYAAICAFTKWLHEDSSCLSETWTGYLTTPLDTRPSSATSMSAWTQL